MDTQRCGAYQEEALILGPALIRGSTVLLTNQIAKFFNQKLSFEKSLDISVRKKLKPALGL